jgi:hypothetical protein
MEIKKVTDAAFKKYGKVVQGIDFGPLVEALAKTPVPEGVDYLPSVAELEATPTFAQLQTKSFGELPTQIGYCNGHNYKLNALEYHRSSEINVGGTDAILLVGLQSDITYDFTYDTSLVEAFKIPKGVAVEFYATTLHYAPCGYKGNGYRVVIVLPKGTNYAKPNNVKDPLVWGVNKWLLAHPDSPEAKEGAYVGLIGENICLKDKI